MKPRLLTLITGLCLQGLTHGQAPQPVGTDKTGKYLTSAGSLTNAEKTTLSGAIRKVRWQVHEGYERVVIDFQRNGDYSDPKAETPAMDRVPSFTILARGAPSSLEFSYSSRVGPGLKPVVFPKECRLFGRFYRIPVLDDATAGAVLEFRRHVELEVFELKNPARLVIDARPSKENDTRPIYVARSKTFAPDEAGEAGHLSEDVGRGNIRRGPDYTLHDGADIVLAADNKSWVVQIGHSLRDWKAHHFSAGHPEKVAKQFFLEKRDNPNAPPPVKFTPHVLEHARKGGD